MRRASKPQRRLRAGPRTRHRDKGATVRSPNRQLCHSTPQAPVGKEQHPDLQGGPSRAKSLGPPELLEPPVVGWGLRFAQRQRAEAPAPQTPVHPRAHTLETDLESPLATRPTTGLDVSHNGRRQGNAGSTGAEGQALTELRPQATCRAGAGEVGGRGPGAQERAQGAGRRAQRWTGKSLSTWNILPGRGTGHLCEFARVAMAKCHRPDGCHDRNLFSHSPGARRVVSSEAPVLGW